MCTPDYLSQSNQFANFLLSEQMSKSTKNIVTKEQKLQTLQKKCKSIEEKLKNLRQQIKNLEKRLQDEITTIEELQVISLK